MGFKKVYAYPPLAKFSWLIAATSTTDWGDLSGRTDESKLNQTQFYRTLDLTSEPVMAEQAHGCKITFISKISAPARGERSRTRADGLVTARSGVSLAIKTADCVPIIVVDTKKRILGLAHAGWKGIRAGVVESMVDKMKEVGSQLADLSVCLGPHLHSCCCEFRQPELNFFIDVFDGADGLVRTNGHKQFLDLGASIFKKLAKSGLVKKQVWFSPECTGCGGEFWSARAQKDQPYLKEVLTVGMIKKDDD